MSSEVFHRSDLLRKINAREAVIGIIGLGYVGLPLTIAAVDKGFRVIGFDINRESVEELNAGKSPLEHIPAKAIGAARAAHLFEATDDFTRLAEGDAIVICVPTPLGRHREPDLTYI
ncbi:MAG: NAD(P)-binding domain-containing protein, partial [Bryobacteraceae bacterium]